jgi:Fur family transcriptional regulator, ferric uptake regulator
MAVDPVVIALRQRAVRLTLVRRAVLNVLLHSPFALSGSEIEKQLPRSFDRITLYRTLCTFEQKGLVHRVIDHSETVRYAVCANPASVASPDHVHFKCTACQHIYCLSQVPVPAVALPGRYRTERRDYLLSGICEACQTE